MNPSCRTQWRLFRLSAPPWLEHRDSSGSSSQLTFDQGNKLLHQEEALQDVSGKSRLQLHLILGKVKDVCKTMNSHMKIFISKNANTRMELKIWNRACPTGRRPRGRPRTRWRDYISRLAWERLGVPPDKLEEVAGEREVWASLLRLLPPRPGLG
ncbi:hypothetical protein ACER0C_003495 [Sarotherodon galilaeus]